jgi:aerobic-type carbon monoxide dehydrogenase small subunit (CoxS/CutS family)
MRIELTVNDHDVAVVAEPAQTLLEVLRSAGLTGAKEACGVGDCGACTVLVDDRRVLACLTLAVRVGGPVRTIESIATGDPALCGLVADLGAVQCGYCVPGQIVTIAGSGLAAGVADARAELAGNICRCTGSVGLVAMAWDEAVGDAPGPPQ